MPLKKSFFYIMLLIFVAFFTSCNTDESMNIEGQLIYSNGGSSINAIALDSSESNILSFYDSDEIVAIDQLTKVNNDTFLFGECTVTGECTIKQYSVGTGQVKPLLSGRLPSYISNHDKLFFYDEAPDGSNWLFSTSVKDISTISKVAKEPKWKTLPNGIKQSITTPIIQISNDDIIFIGEDGELWLHNILDKKLIPTGIKDCRPVLWIEQHSKLLCSDWDTWIPYVLDMNTKSKIEMQELKGAYGFVYMPSSDSLIYGKTRSSFIIGEAYDIFLYSLMNKEEKRIKKGSHIAAGIWLDKTK